MKKGIVKKIFGFLGIAMVATFGSYHLVNTLEKHDIIDVGGGIYVGQLSTPQDIYVENNILNWQKVFNGKEYVIKIDDDVYKTTESSYDLSFLEPDTYEIKVKATGNSVRDSEWSDAIYHQVFTEEEQKAYDLYQVKEKIIESYKFKYPHEGSYEVPIVEKTNNGYQGVIYIQYNNSFSICEFEINVQTDNIGELIKNINLSNMNIVNSNYFNKDKVNIYENAPKFDILKEYQSNGWKVEIINQGVAYTDYDINAEIVNGKYSLFVKCEKDGKTKYIHCQDKIGVYSFYASTDLLYDAFENGTLDEVKESYVKEYSNSIFEQTSEQEQQEEMGY